MGSVLAVQQFSSNFTGQNGYSGNILGVDKETSNQTPKTGQKNNPPFLKLWEIDFPTLIGTHPV